MANHAVSDEGISAIKEIVTKIKVARVLAGGSVGNCSYSSRNFEKLSQQVELHRLIHLDAYEFARLGSRAFPATIECQGSVGKTAPVSHGIHVVPREEKSPEISRCAGNAA